jgi:hypothetical protein
VGRAGDWQRTHKHTYRRQQMGSMVKTFLFMVAAVVVGGVVKSKLGV